MRKYKRGISKRGGIVNGRQKNYSRAKGQFAWIKRIRNSHFAKAKSYSRKFFRYNSKTR